MTPRAEHPPLHLTALRCLQALLACFFVFQLFADFLYPLRARTLGLEWWSWIWAAAPLLLVAALEALRRQARGAPLRLPGEAAERIRRERPRRYGRTH